MKLNEKLYTLATIVENKPGVLFRTANMFRRRGFNIESISVGTIEQDGLSRMTITVYADEDTAEQIIKQLSKLIDVIKVNVLDEAEIVKRELALIKIQIQDSRALTELTNYCNIFRNRIIDVSPDSMIIEVTGTPDKVDAFVQLVQGYGIREMARTGITALQRGSKK
ncbi:MAG: acetolactate synthase small subunit [Thaumarchaeota archaeon]|nr:acetolactate synthase small subunit [Nitrososphaerota archaeon]MCL5316884.1 acetolactate synthase small subunit [Nitrososphaerota archaeon]